MAAPAEGMPCWADAMFSDIEAAKSFYGDVLGWTFGESQSEYGNYTQAYVNGKAVAAVVPPMPGQDEQSAWCLYLASPDVAATARKIRDNGGSLLMEPMQVGDFGSMALASDPSGVVFGVWQAGRHEGFEATGVPGAFAWAQVFTREPAKADAFFPAVFPYRVNQVVGEEMDFRLFALGDDNVLGRMRMGADFPAEVPPFLQVYFTVSDCDAAIDTATRHGAILRFGPMDTPFGRLAALSDPQGASFAVVDPTTTKGEMPRTAEA